MAIRRSGGRRRPDAHERRPGIFDGDPRAAESQELAGSRPEGLYSLARRFHGQRADVAGAVRAVERIATALATTRSPACARLAADVASDLVPVGASREEAERPRRFVRQMLGPDLDAG
ncbi:hypothetical protein NKH77_27715 [Streptomyces sp. M19]